MASVGTYAYESAPALKAGKRKANKRQS